jgi:hypothetical protein
MAQQVPFGLIFNSVLLVIGFIFLRKLIGWIMRIRAFRKTMPTIATLFPPESPYRLLWPKRWQTFHKDWHMQYQRSIYRKLDSDIFAIVCLFEYDKVFVSDPAAVLDLKIFQPREFPRDMHVFKRVYSNVVDVNVVCCVWKKCSGDDW